MENDDNSSNNNYCKTPVWDVNDGENYIPKFTSLCFHVVVSNPFPPHLFTFLSNYFFTSLTLINWNKLKTELKLYIVPEQN